jgi:hypothetical protein
LIRSRSRPGKEAFRFVADQLASSAEDGLSPGFTARAKGFFEDSLCRMFERSLAEMVPSVFFAEGPNDSNRTVRAEFLANKGNIRIRKSLGDEKLQASANPVGRPAIRVKGPDAIA